MKGMVIMIELPSIAQLQNQLRSLAFRVGSEGLVEWSIEAGMRLMPADSCGPLAGDWTIAQPKGYAALR